MSFRFINAELNANALSVRDEPCPFFKRYNTMQTKRVPRSKISAGSCRPALAVVILILTITAVAAPTPSLSELKGMTVSFPVEGGAMSGVLFVPAWTPAPAVIVLHTKGLAVEPADVKFAETLANEGFVAVAVNYLEGAGGKLWAPVIDERLSQVVDLLRERPEVGDKPVGVVGFSLGAHGILVSALNPAVKAVVVYYGAYDPRKAKGKHFGHDVKLPIDVVTEVNAAVMMLHGSLDNEVPVQIARDMEAALKSAGKKVELVVYPGAYHRFDRGPTARMSGNRTRDGFIYQYDEAAEKDARKRTIAWFHTYLDGP
ncbi:MAG TPA: dienelactone hydrolase family protein [Nitrospirota bacterium]|nr:dienelactone hydrolase family protein [Nitrospirota bacterium]